MSDAVTRLHAQMVDVLSNWERFKNLFDGNGRESLPTRLHVMEEVIEEKPWEKEQEAFEERWKEFLKSDAAKERSGAGRFERIVLALGVIASLWIQLLGG